MELTFTALLILKTIDQSQRGRSLIRLNEIADSVAVCERTARRRVKELQREGLITTFRAGPGRAYEIKINPKGKKVLQEWLQ